ncbi:hypothetical protein HDV00_000882 [Rhizophlyctis rosea]|nr:hypothetical protein HDV00_000882 [Rhizophlyctis rosea]
MSFLLDEDVQLSASLLQVDQISDSISVSSWTDVSPVSVLPGTGSTLPLNVHSQPAPAAAQSDHNSRKRHKRDFPDAVNDIASSHQYFPPWHSGQVGNHISTDFTLLQGSPISTESSPQSSVFTDTPHQSPESLANAHVGLNIPDPVVHNYSQYYIGAEGVTHPIQQTTNAAPVVSNRRWPYTPDGDFIRGIDKTTPKAFVENSPERYDGQGPMRPTIQLRELGMPIGTTFRVYKLENDRVLFRRNDIARTIHGVTDAKHAYRLVELGNKIIIPVLPSEPTWKRYEMDPRRMLITNKTVGHTANGTAVTLKYNTSWQRSSADPGPGTGYRCLWIEFGKEEQEPGNVWVNEADVKETPLFFAYALLPEDPDEFNDNFRKQVAPGTGWFFEGWFCDMFLVGDPVGEWNPILL